MNKLRVVFSSLMFILTGCGGGSNSSPSALELSSAVGDYSVEVALTSDEEGCTELAELNTDQFSSTASLSQADDSSIKIYLSEFNITLDGVVDGDVITAEGGFAIGGLGAGVISTTWIYDNGNFIVSYSYFESFVGTGVSCPQEFDGTARKI